MMPMMCQKPLLPLDALLAAVNASAELTQSAPTFWPEQALPAVVPLAA
jgi:hypothetical protein